VFRGTEVAVKVIIDPVITQELKDEFENEITMLNSLRHPHTVLLMGVCTRPPHLALIFEYANKGTVYDLLHRSRQEWDMQSRERVIL